MSSISHHALPGQATRFAKRILVVDPDRPLWETRARLLIAKGYVVHRISGLAEAPPRWPAHLYDLVVLATEDPANAEVLEFCRRLQHADPPVRTVLLAREIARPACSVPVIHVDKSPTEIADDIAELLSHG